MTNDIDRQDKGSILRAWADGQLKTAAACERLDCTPVELIDTAALHEVDLPVGLRLPTYTLPEDGPWSTVELLLANGFELIVTGADDVEWPSSDPDVVDAALQGRQEALIAIVDNLSPDTGWENLGYIELRDEGEGLVQVGAVGGIASLRRILALPEPAPRSYAVITDEVSAALDLEDEDDLNQIARDNGIEPPSTSIKP